MVRGEIIFGYGDDVIVNFNLMIMIGGCGFEILAMINFSNCQTH